MALSIVKLCRLALVLAVWLSAAWVRADSLPSLGGAEWAQGPHSAMHMLLEKTIFNVDVLTVDVRVKKDVQRRLLDVIGQRKDYSEELGVRLAAVVLAADDALIQVRYLRSVSFKQWLEGVGENLDRAEAAKLVSKEVRRRIEERIPIVFAAIKERGYERGDRLFYVIRANSIRMVVVSETGTIHVDRTDDGREPPRVALASYFAPQTDFREPLLRSLFD